MLKSIVFSTAAAALMICSTAVAQSPAEYPGFPDGTKADTADTAAENDMQAQIDELKSQIAQLKLETAQARSDAENAKQSAGQAHITANDAKLSANDAKINSETQSSAAKYIEDRFKFGSYGRVQPSMNPEHMSSGRQARIVYPSPRVDEGSYVELNLKYTPYKSDDDDTVVDVVTTLALDGEKLFHYDGNWDAGIAIRNLYVEARNLWFDGFVLWAGSRMYRGDDIYLLDTWPLDNLNTYGGGLGWHGHTRTNIDLHFGTNRLKNDYQYQVVDVVNERFVGEQEVVFLDRQRFIASLKAEQLYGGGDTALFKTKLYAEIHAIGEGEILQKQPEAVKKLPDDIGWLVGLQFGVSNFLGDSYFNFFLKYAAGLAAYGEQAVPFGVNTDMRAEDAKNLTVGLTMGLDILNYVDILLAGYVRYFADADGIVNDFDDGVEGVWDIRVVGHVGKYFRPGIEFSQQLRKPYGLSPVSGKQELASLFKFSLLPAVRFGDGVLGRPEIRFNYTLSVLNDAARNLFPERDRLRTSTYEHYIGIAAEWWFNL